MRPVDPPAEQRRLAKRATAVAVADHIRTGDGRRRLATTGTECEREAEFKREYAAHCGADAESVIDYELDGEQERHGDPRGTIRSLYHQLHQNKR